MSTAANPGPNNLILLAVIGIGAYWLFTRRAAAGPVYTTGAQQQPSRASTDLAKLGLAVQGTNLIGRLLTNLGTAGGYYSARPNITQQGLENVAAIYNSDSNPDLNGSVSDWLSSSVDGLAVNPPGNVGAYDWYQ